MLICILPEPCYANDVAPPSHWKYGLLDAIGEEKFGCVMGEIKAMAQAIESRVFRISR